jgi:hypothetical protein
MKIDKVIFSCDDSYLMFWEHTSEVIKKVLNIEPVLFFINEEEETDFYQDKFGTIKKIKKVDFIDSSLLSQIYRFYGTKFFQNEVCMISDVDMFLFNKYWVNDHLNEKNEDDLVIMNSDAYDPKRIETLNHYPRYPACYSVGKGSTFNKILNTDRSIEDYTSEVSSLNAGWDSDEIYFTNKLIYGDHNVNYHLIKRGYSSYYYVPGRIEKYMFNPEESQQVGKLNLNGTINFDTFIDCHAWRWNMDLVKKIKSEILEFYK